MTVNKQTYYQQINTFDLNKQPSSQPPTFAVASAPLPTTATSCQHHSTAPTTTAHPTMTTAKTVTTQVPRC
ncbi:hypothetical protein K443DRAFT_6845 [Laccaria amethystina LaAM-08-1]|uniref:Uncharacterized protein n=1 Tax=Laccaria amethystina LaAM-08-1 TaxID=1095629 RepID=A0A0C9XVD6_9AGAR|nr:hypothetical protein K443DRAFT_6845 [Laccaria amethystina LaAM-08-1]